jgi:hypothetical protein
MLGPSTLSLDYLPAADNIAAIWAFATSFLAAEIEVFERWGAHAPLPC